MARLALCAVGLVLAAPTARAGHRRVPPADQYGLFQIAADAATEKPKVDVGYASEDFKEGMLVEAKLPNGTWAAGAIQGLRTGDAWDVKVPGEEEPQSVPAKMLRRHLDKGESDWLVVEKYRGWLAASGITYRRSKDMEDLNGKRYAPFNSLVVGRDEGDGWLKVSKGYLPMKVNGVQVLAKRDRRGTVALSKELRDWYLGAEEARRKAVLAKATLEPPPLQIYSVNEEVLFQSFDGKWRPAQVKTSAITSYGVLVREAGGNEYMVPRAMPSDLKKAGPPKHTPIPGESPVCRKEGGCIDLILRVGPDEEHKTHAALGMTIHFLMRSACAALRDPPSCQTRLALWHRGRALGPSWRTFEAGLTNGTVVDVRLAPESVTPLWEVPE